MSYFLFMDESGHDLKESPYEVLAGICIEDRDLWNFICTIQDAERQFFGQRITPGLLELKAKKLLNTKVYRLARQSPGIAPNERSRLALQCLQKGEASKGQNCSGATRAELTALAQAKIAFVEHVLELCGQYRVRAFSSIVDRDALRPEGKDFLRKDYSFLFERFFYYLDDQPGRQQGLVVFDELERSQCHILLDQMTRYFRDTARGRQRASLVIPEPFFVHSHLTTAIQVADLVAYIVAWGVRIPGMNRPARKELEALAQRVKDCRYRTLRESDSSRHEVWSFVVLNDLRPKNEQGI